MERLEAALQKARQDRNVTHSVVQPSIVTASPAPAPIDIWETIKQIKISPRVARNHRISTLKQNRSSGPYDLLRSRALRIMGENSWTSMAITSPNKSCGKTTICVNLALSFSRQLDLKILVLDLDLRRPSLHRILGHRSDHSLHDVLRGDQPFENAFVRAAPNLAFGLNNSAARDPSELLQSRQAKGKFDEIKAAFQPDLMIFDMPPMLVGDENVGFLPAVDCGLLVSAADSTTMQQLDVCEKELAGLTNVLGIVLNKCRFNDADTAYDYNYY